MVCESRHRRLDSAGSNGKSFWTPNEIDRGGSLEVPIMNVLKRWVIAIIAAMLVALVLTLLGFRSPVVPIAGGFTAVFFISFLKTRGDIKSERRR